MIYNDLTFGNHIPPGWDRSGSDGGSTSTGVSIPASAMKEILALRAELAKVLVDKPITVHLAQAKGQTMEEIRNNFYQSGLYKMGDASLYWINEGDLTMLTIFGNVVYCDGTETNP